ncbi:MAG: phosphatase PAP2 family protein, partial [Thermoplasmatota archaeon]
AVRRPRPRVRGLPPLASTPTGLSFPSAHAATSLAGAQAFAPLAAPMGLHALAWGLALSRLYLGVHYPSDLLGGAALGVLRLRQRRLPPPGGPLPHDAVAAQLALDAGHEVAAVTLELWADPATDGTKACCSPQAVVAARALAHGMGLPHFTLDLRDEFRRTVVNDFLAGYAGGRTPNPC